MSSSNELVIGLVAGFALNLVASAVYDWLKTRGVERAARVQATANAWKQRLEATDPVVRSEAFQETLARSLFWFILGNVMFAVSGLSWALEFAALYPISNILASATSVLAVLTFAASIRWLRLYLNNRAIRGTS